MVRVLIWFFFTGRGADGIAGFFTSRIQQRKRERGMKLRN